MSRHDFLSYVLSSLRVSTSAVFIFDFDGPWGIEADDIPMPISFTVMEGDLWLVSRKSQPIALSQGDTILLPRGIQTEPRALVSSLDISPVNAADLVRMAHEEAFEPGMITDRPVHIRGGQNGASARVVSAAFGFDVRKLGPLIVALPEVMVVRATDRGSDLVDILLRKLIATDADEVGFSALLTHTAQLVLVQVIRTYAMTRGTSQIGWLAGLEDARIARALTCIHCEPHNDWSVAALARRAGMSRSAFAQHFLDRIGQSPMQYLRSWRMHLAQQALSTRDVTISSLAGDLGYESEAAFRLAFRRTTGQTPRDFRRQSTSFNRKRQ